MFADINIAIIVVDVFLVVVFVVAALCSAEFSFGYVFMLMAAFCLYQLNFAETPIEKMNDRRTSCIDDGHHWRETGVKQFKDDWYAVGECVL